MNLAKTASESHSEFIFEEVVKIKDQICQGELVYSIPFKMLAMKRILDVQLHGFNHLSQLA